MRSWDLLLNTVVIWGTAIVLMAALLALPVAAQDERRLVLDPSQAPFNLAKHAEYVMEQGTTGEDWSMRMNVSDLIALDERAFSKVETRQIGFGWNPSIVHVRVPLQNPIDKPQDWLLSFNDMEWGYGIVFLVVDGEPLPSSSVLSFEPGMTRTSWDSFVNATLTLPENANAMLYVSYQNPASAAALSLEVPADYQTRRLLEDIWIYILIGLSVGVMLLSVSIIGVLHQRVAIYYAGYVASATIHFCFILDLFHPSELLSRLTHSIDSLYVWGAISSVFYMLFQYAFFATEDKINVRFRKALLGAAGVNALLLFGFAVLGMPYLYYVLWSTVCLALITTSGVLAIVHKITGGVFFAISCFVLAGTILPLALSDFLTAHYTFGSVKMFSLYGVAIEAITLAIAMFAKVRRIRSERANALEAELASTREKLDAVRRMATAAHDIQQPLASLKLAVANNEGGRAKSQDIDGAIDYLNEIVRTQMAEAKSDLSDEDDEESDLTEDFDLSFVLETLCSMFEDEALKKGLRLRNAPTTLRIKSNPLALTRILSNLVTNAIRNTESGGILIGGRRRGAEVRIDVTDTGSGLPRAALDELQKPFTRHGSYDGQGLGLTSVRHLCQEHGIKLDCTSLPDRGTTFHITVPMATSVARISSQRIKTPSY